MAIFSELPDSLVSKSLVRLPVKSLAQCRCVCKSWYNLVSDPYFIYSHLSQQLIDEKEYLISEHLSLSSWREWYSFRCDETFLEKLKVECPFPESRRAFRLVDCAKGLLLMLNPETSDLHLWNPGFQNIKPLPSASATYKNISHREAIGFAFLPDICDYKVIRIFDFSDCSGVASFAEIYSLKMDSWRRIEAPVIGLPIFSRASFVASFLNNIFYWVVQDNHFTDFILAFNIKCETFKMEGLPVAYLQEGCMPGSLAVFKKSLYLFALHVGKGHSLWIMEESCSGGMNWKKINTFEYQDRWPLGFIKNGDVIMEDVERKVSLHDPRNMMSPRKPECKMVWNQQYQWSIIIPQVLHYLIKEMEGVSHIIQMMYVRQKVEFAVQSRSLRNEECHHAAGNVKLRAAFIIVYLIAN